MGFSQKIHPNQRGGAQGAEGLDGQRPASGAAASTARRASGGWSGPNKDQKELKKHLNTWKKSENRKETIWKLFGFLFLGGFCWGAGPFCQVLSFGNGIIQLCSRYIIYTSSNQKWRILSMFDSNLMISFAYFVLTPRGLGKCLVLGLAWPSDVARLPKHFRKEETCFKRVFGGFHSRAPSKALRKRFQCSCHLDPPKKHVVFFKGSSKKPRFLGQAIRSLRWVSPRGPGRWVGGSPQALLHTIVFFTGWQILVEKP